MTSYEIQQLQSLSDEAYSFIKFHIPRLATTKTWKELSEITGLDSTRLQRICQGKLGETSSRFLIRACTGLAEYLESNPYKPISPKKARGNAV